VVHKFEVKNTGKVAVEQSDLTITWPMQVINSANQKLHLLYIMEAPQVKGNTRQQEGARCTIDTKFVNPDNIKVKVSNPDSIREGGSDAGKQLTRRKRDAAPNYEPGIGDWVCGKSSSIVCTTIKCKVFELRPAESVLISIRSRFWNRTISSTFPDAYELLLRSTASIAIDQEGLSITQSDTTNDIGQAGTKLNSSEKKSEEVALWIIILSVCAGILLLVILVIVLWRVGFFKRNKPNPFADTPQHTGALVKKGGDDEEEEGRDVQH
jgi:integrin alpha 7